VLYGRIGHPGMPDAPLAARLEAAPQQMDIAAAIAKIEAHLKEHPEDGRGYEVLAPVYLRLGRAGDAVNAARAALRLLGTTPARETFYGETLVAAADGVVTPAARQSFETAAVEDPLAAKPRFFLGLAAEQAGDKGQAKAIWSKLIADAPPDAAWAQVLRKRIAALEAEPGRPPDEAAITAQPQPEAGQTDAIRAMVEGLAARLAQNGRDLQGWLRLVRSYTVLQEPGKARSALIDAKRNLAGDEDAIARLEALARELGLES
jgi:cytochrome c-type biogenesis protein CcmH